MNIMPVSGGGGGLNFRVIGGTTAPAKPKENDIWVNTDVKITEWVFSGEEPFIRKENVDCVIAKEATRLDSTGTEGYFPQANLTDYIKLPDGTTKITTNNCDTVTSTMCHAFYTADKTLISTVLRKEGTTTFEVPTNAVYVRLSMFDNAPVNSDPLYFVATIGVESGFVWIFTGNSSSAEFNALKKNGITVYPLSAKQYVSGKCVDKTAKSYQGGAWVDWWNGELYDSGNEYTTFTGGWKATASSSTTQVTKSSADMTIKTDYGGDSLYCSNKIDLTNFSKLVVTGKSFRNNSSATRTQGNTKICIWSDVGTDGSSNRVAYADYPAEDYDGEFELDVSSLIGEYYVGVYAGRYYSVTVRKAKLS